MNFKPVVQAPVSVGLEQASKHTVLVRSGKIVAQWVARTGEVQVLKWKESGEIVEQQVARNGEI